jgi:hypothetical protein
LYHPTDITFTDPRTFDGNPYDVAERAIAQCEGILELYAQALTAAFLMARNADMERNLALRLPPAGSSYWKGPQGRQFEKLTTHGEESLRILGALKTAVAYDPKHPPRP